MTLAVKPGWWREDLTILEDSAQRFFENEFAPHMARWEENQQIDRDAWHQAGAAGLLCASMPTEYGGGGGTYAHEAVISRAQLRAGVSGFGNSVHSGIVAPYINAYGSEGQKQRWLPRLASGDIVAAIAMTEPGTGSDLQSVKTTAKLDGNQYVINGSKTFITNGHNADLVIVVAKTDESEGAKSVSLICVEVNEVEGFARGKNLEKIGQKAQDTSELFFDGVRVPTSNLLGNMEGRGFYQLMQQLPQERLIIADGAIVAMECALDETIAYVKDRQAFGKPVMAFQNTRFKLAEAKTKLEVARAFVDACTGELLEGGLSVERAAMAKWWCTQMQCEVVDECLQLFGGYGYMNEYPIAKMWADARVQKIYGGTNEIMKELIGRML